MMNASLIESKFLRTRPKLGFTKLWGETDNYIRTIILENIIFQTNEVPIINHFSDIQHWWLLSNDLLYIMDGSMNKYKFKEFKKIEMPQAFYQDVHNGKLTTIQILNENKHIELVIEPLSWAVIYSILNFVKGK